MSHFISVWPFMLKGWVGRVVQILAMDNFSPNLNYPPEIFHGVEGDSPAENHSNSLSWMCEPNRCQNGPTTLCEYSVVVMVIWTWTPDHEMRRREKPATRARQIHHSFVHVWTFTISHLVLQGFAEAVCLHACEIFQTVFRVVVFGSFIFMSGVSGRKSVTRI